MHWCPVGKGILGRDYWHQQRSLPLAVPLYLGRSDTSKSIPFKCQPCAFVEESKSAFGRLNKSESSALNWGCLKAHQHVKRIQMWWSPMELFITSLQTSFLQQEVLALEEIFHNQSLPSLPWASTIVLGHIATRSIGTMQTNPMASVHFHASGSPSPKPVRLPGRCGLVDFCFPHSPEGSIIQGYKRGTCLGLWGAFEATL